LSILDRILPDFPEDQRAERNRLLGLMGMFFLVVTAVGILKPVRNAFALAGLGERDFYKVYLVSAVVILFVPIYNRMADRIGWRRLVPAVAVFFGLNLVVFRLLYSEGSTLLGVVFYGWYDLLAAALVTQFFVATHLFLTARSAKSAYPLVIGGGAIGAMLGGGIAGVLATMIGTENLLLVGALFVLAFGIGIGFVWPEQAADELERARSRGIHRRESVSIGELQRVFSNSHVQLIAVGVLLIVLAKQLVDYEYNTLTEQIFVTQDAIARFQGLVNLATQWLPLASVLTLRPLLKRWGVGAIVFILPGLMLVTSLGMAAVFSIWTVIAVRTADTTFRYSAERAGREILYVPVPEDIKLKAKTYIDVGVEKGLGKALSAGVLALLVDVLGLRLPEIAWVVVALTGGWLAVTVLIRREYVRTLARSIQGRYASFQGLSVLSDASTQRVVRTALQSDDPVQTSFALDLVAQSAGTDTGPLADTLHGLLDHDQADIRLKALGILADDPDAIELPRIRPRLRDPDRRVREEAVLAMVAQAPDHVDEIIASLLASLHADVRTAALACLASGELPQVQADEVLGAQYLEDRLERASEGDREARIELALVAGALPSHPSASRLLKEFLTDSDPQVVTAALRSATLLERPELHDAMIAALQPPTTREAAREALAEQGPRAVDALARSLMDEEAPPAIRRHIPSVLARVRDPRAAQVMLHSVVAPETDQILDYRTLKALSQLRVRAPEIPFDGSMVRAAIQRELGAAGRYDRARRCLKRVGADGPCARLLTRSLEEAWAERREGIFHLLGLLYEPEAMYRCYLALSGGGRRSRANAIEWLEETVDRETFDELTPVLGETSPERPLPDPRGNLGPLLRDGDPWIARLAIAAVAEIGAAWSKAALRGIIETGPTDDLTALAEQSLASPERDGTRMDLIEKVFLLQKIDLLQDARSAHLALLASIAEDVDVDAGTVLLRQGEPTGALYVVVDGVVDLESVDGQQIEATDGRAFGTWALIDEAPSLVTATVRDPTRLLRITRSDFYDLLADHSELALGLLQGLARRVRTLVA
jgi:ATP/ADP translocase/HEAT repeat protein